MIVCKCQACGRERSVEDTRRSEGAKPPGRRLELIGPQGTQAHHWRDIETAEPCACGSRLVVLVYDMRDVLGET